MENCYINLASSEATADEVNLIERQRASGNFGPVCLVTRNVARPVDDLDGYVGFKWLEKLHRFLHKDAD